jgi:phage shock protein A
MSAAKRVLRTLKGKADKRQDSAEDPGEALDASYARQLELLAQVRRSAADVTAAREHVEAQINGLRQKQMEPDDQAGQRRGTGESRQGRQAPEAKVAIETVLSDLAAQRNSLQADEDKLMAASRRLEAKVEAFRLQKAAIKAVYTVAEAEQRISKALSSIYKEMDHASISAISSRRQLEVLAQVRADVEEVIASREHLEALVSSLGQRQAELEDKARRALGAGREDLAREALARNAAISSQLSDLMAQLNSIQADEAKLVNTYERLAANMEAF